MAYGWTRPLKTPMIEIPEQVLARLLRQREQLGGHIRHSWFRLTQWRADTAATGVPLGISPHLRGDVMTVGAMPIGLRSLLRGMGILVCTILGACTSNPHSERTHLAAPSLVSTVYSDTNLRLMLALSPNLKGECEEFSCLDRAFFDERVAAIGGQLAQAAFLAYPQLAGRVAGFEFVVEDKAEPATASTARGLVVVMRATRAIAPDDETLSFLIAREMGHIVAQHHEESTGTSIVVSALSAIFLPVANVAKLIGTLFSGTSLASAASTTASASVTAASLAGSRMLAEAYRPRQRDEADDIAMRLLAARGYDYQAIARGFARQDLRTPPTRWLGDLRDSVGRIALLAEREAAAMSYARQVPAVAQVAARPVAESVAETVQ